MPEPVVHVAMLGARMHYAAPRVLNAAGLLGRLFTDTYIGNKPVLRATLNLIPERARLEHIRRLLGRAASDLEPEKVVSYDLFGLQCWWRRQRALDPVARTRVYAQTAREFNRRVLRSGLVNASAVFGFDGACLEMFEAARARGLHCILEQTIMPRRIQRQFLLEECERWPGWEPGLSSLPETDDLTQREEREWELSDVIVGGSQFVINGLVGCGVSESKCRVVPYGMDTRQFAPAASTEQEESNRALRVLFAGEVGLRKGAPYLLEALRELGPARVQARLAGSIAVSPQKLEPYLKVAEFLGSVPRSQMMGLFHWADVFCLPSICEGSALVIYESLLSGLPVIATPNTGSQVRDGVDGQVVPVRDSEAIARALDRYRIDRQYLHSHRLGARDASEHLGLPVYQRNLVRVVEELFR